MNAQEFSLHIKDAKYSDDGWWTGTCPTHPDATPSLRWRDGETALVFKCMAGCEKADILNALHMTWADIRHAATAGHQEGAEARQASRGALTVDDLAGAKALPADFLRSLGVRDTEHGVEIEYRLVDGTVAPRQRLRKKLAGKSKSLWLGPKNRQVEPYIPTGAGWRIDSTGQTPCLVGTTVGGLDDARAAGFTFIVEGESDIWTLRFLSYHGIGIPGASMTKVLGPEHVAGLDLLYIAQEPDSGGDSFVFGMRKRLREIEWSGRALVIAMPNGLKDVNDLWRACAGDWKEFLFGLDRAIAAAVPLNDEAAEAVDERLTPVATPAGKRYHLTPFGNSGRLVDMFGEDIAHVHELGWLTWTGQRWRVDAGEYRVQQRAKAVVKALHAEGQKMMAEGEALRRAAKAEDNPEKMATASVMIGDAATMLRWAMRCERLGALTEMTNLSKSVDAVLREHREFDAFPMLFNVANGTLDLRNGELRPHRREDRITQISPVVYDSAAAAPTWERFLLDIMLGRNSLVSYLQRLVGYCLTGDTREQMFAVLYGHGANGKSTLLEVLRALFGSEYARQSPASTFLQKKESSGGASPEIARLRGSRLVTTVEPERGRRLAEGVIKSMTGGDVQTARHLFKEFFEFAATHKVLIACNHRPRVTSPGHAMWRRPHSIPFDARFEGESDDKSMGRRLLAELPGILNWAVKGCLEWQRQGLNPPKEILESTEEWRKQEDTMAEFWDEHCIFSPGAKVPAPKLFEAYRNWSASVGLEQMSRTAFGVVVGEKGIVKPKAERFNQEVVKVYRGIGLVDLKGREPEPEPTSAVTSVTSVTGSPERSPKITETSASVPPDAHHDDDEGFIA